MGHDRAVSSYRRAFLQGIRRRERLIVSMRYIILVLCIAVWEGAAQLGIIDPFITSSPSRVVATLARLLEGGELFLHIGVTLFETVAGFVIGTLLGTLIAPLLWWSNTL